MQIRRRRSGRAMRRATRLMQPSPYWGTEKIWDTKANNHNGMFDKKGRVWFAARVRGPDNPDFCKKGSDHPSAKLFPMERTNRQVTMLDPKTGQYTYVDTCFETHHLQFGYDANDTLWTSGGGPVVGWINTKMLDETGDVAKSQGWTALILDTNGNGKRDEYVEPNQPVDPNKGQAHRRGLLRRDAESGRRLDLGLVSDQSRGRRTARSGIKSAGDGARRDLQRADAGLRHPRRRHRPPGRRLGIARERSPGQFRRSASARGRSTGQRRPAITAPKGWTFHQYPGPGFQGIGENSAESSYYTWVDQHNTFGLGEDVPMSTGNLNDGLIAMKDGKMIVLTRTLSDGILR